MAPYGHASAHRPQSSSLSGVILTFFHAKRARIESKRSIRTQPAAVGTPEKHSYQDKDGADHEHVKCAGDSEDADERVPLTDEEATRHLDLPSCRFSGAGPSRRTSPPGLRYT